MAECMNRRSFLKKSVISSAGATLGLSLKQNPLSADTAEKSPLKMPQDNKGGMPMGQIGNLKVSRLICGGNLIGGWAHSRDLIYVSELFKAYNTEEKIFDTLQLAEEKGINAIITNPKSGPVINKYWKKRGGRIQWIPEGHPKSNDLKTDIQKSIDTGASAVYIQGGVADRWVKHGRPDLVAKAVDFIKSNNLPGGFGAHSLKTVVECLKAGAKPDFIMKTLHHSNYWSYKRTEQTEDVISNKRDNYWSITPEETIEFMKTFDKPWLAFKVLAAGAIHPKNGFKYAFENGADFICVGMFDFQIREDVFITKEILSKLAETDRTRPWRA